MEVTSKNPLSWTEELDNYLQTLVSLHGTNDWDSIAVGLNVAFPSTSKTAQECWERWRNNLGQAESKTTWTEQEELKMLIAHQRHQNKWSNMAQELCGKSNNSIKNRFYSIFRKVKNKILKQDFNHESKIELLETLYMISLMEKYFQNPQTTQKQINKRGKDFIYSLLKGFQLDLVKRYKADLQKSGDQETSLDKLWIEVVGSNHLIKSEIQIPKKDNFTTELLDNGRNRDKNVFYYITGPPSNDKLSYTLPLPNFLNNSAGLTIEEKDFIKSQVFGNFEPCLPNASYPPFVMALPYYSPVTLSTGLPLSAPTATLFEGFSDFTERNCHKAKGYTQPLDYQNLIVPESQMIMGNYAYGNKIM